MDYEFTDYVGDRIEVRKQPVSNTLLVVFLNDIEGAEMCFNARHIKDFEKMLEMLKEVTAQEGGK